MGNISLFKAGVSTRDYYKTMNDALKAIDGDYHMLHYPLYLNGKDTFAQAQKNLIDYCVGKLPSLEDKMILDIGCGNGVLALYVAGNYQPDKIVGVDLNAGNIEIAIREKNRRNIDNVEFMIADAQDLSDIESNSFDVVVNIESAFHYPNKNMFLGEIYRVLKPGGNFVVADILTTHNGDSKIKKNWKNKMLYNHWTMEKYLEGFELSGLKLKEKDDITENVIKGFLVYRDYFMQFKIKGFLRKAFIKLFFVVNVKLIISLLKNKRKYLVFQGVKESAA